MKYRPKGGTKPFKCPEGLAKLEAPWFRYVILRYRYYTHNEKNVMQVYKLSNLKKILKIKLTSMKTVCKLKNCPWKQNTFSRAK